MQLPWHEHFTEIVVPAWQSYLSTEKRLSDALTAADDHVSARSKYDALREGGAATFYVHHFGEVVLRARPHWLPPEINNPLGVRNWLGPHCTMLRSDKAVGDVALLGDVADALKHAILRNNSREVSASEAVLVLKSGYGRLGYGEGKYGGGDQVLVLAKSGPRALSSILQNVIDAWRRVADLPLPSIGQP